MKAIEHDCRTEFESLKRREAVGFFVASLDQGAQMFGHETGQNEVAAMTIGFFDQNLCESDGWSIRQEEGEAIKDTRCERHDLATLVFVP